MPLTRQQIETLIKLVCTTVDDCLDCDQCCDYIAAFAESKLEGKSVPEALKIVQVHIEQCPCCADELNLLLEALKAEDGGI